MRRRSFLVEFRHLIRNASICLELRQEFFVSDGRLVPAIHEISQILKIVQEPLIICHRQDNSGLLASLVRQILNRSNHKGNLQRIGHKSRGKFPPN